jgi:hypothetical protein
MNPYRAVTERVRTAYVLVIGRLWCGVRGAYRYELSDADLRAVSAKGEFDRESVEAWLSKHAGDFATVDDFFAQCGDTEVPWENGDASEGFYFDCVYGEDEETDPEIAASEEG